MKIDRAQAPRFIDLFCGIGGMRLAFESVGGRCVFSSDWDKFAQQTYAANFGETPHGDIRQIRSEEIPDHDILVGGFPCQPFSISGVSKKNSLGRAHGFEDRTQGTLFFEIARVIRVSPNSPFFSTTEPQNLVSPTPMARPEATTARFPASQIAWTAGAAQRTLSTRSID